MDSGSAIFLSVVEALTVKTQILVPVAPHVVVLSHSSVFSKGDVVVAFLFSVLSVRETFYSLLVILGHGAGSVLNR